MKYQQVSVDLVNMMTTACSYLALAGAVWVLLRLLQACFWLPRHFKEQNNVQRLLQNKVDSYGKYSAECEARDKLAGVNSNLDAIDDDSMSLDVSGNSNKWREQRESLELLKNELSRVRNGINVTDCDYLLESSQEEAAKFENSIKSEDEKAMRQKQATTTAKVYLEKEEQCDQEIKITDGKKDQ